MPSAPPIAALLAVAVIAAIASLGPSTANAAPAHSAPSVATPTRAAPAHTAPGSAAAPRTTSRPANPRAATTPPVDYRVSFDSRARLGGHAAITMRLKVDDRILASPATEIELFTPRGLDITSSDLGMETCQLPEASISNVLAGSAAQQPCPPNSLLGRGTATAMLRFTPGEAPILGLADINLYSGDPKMNRPGLTIFVAALNPVSTGLAYTGYLFNAPRPYGIGMKLQLPLIPSPPFGATVSLAEMNVTIGGRDIVYTEQVKGKTVRYRPEGLGLPSRCPRGGFPFRVRLKFANGSQRNAVTRVRCPKRH